MVIQRLPQENNNQEEGSQQRRSQLKLPYTAWADIASYLDSAKDLTTFGQINSYCREISRNEDFWVNNIGYETIGVKYRRAPYKDVTFYHNGQFLWRKLVNQADDDLDLQENDHKFWHVGWKEDDSSGLHGHMLRMQLFINHPLQNDSRFGKSIVEYNSAQDKSCAFDISFHPDLSRRSRDSSMYERQPSIEKNHFSVGTSPVWCIPAVPEIRTNNFTMILKFKLENPNRRVRNILFGSWQQYWLFLITRETDGNFGLHLRRNLYTKQRLARGGLNVGSEPMQDFQYHEDQTIRNEEEAEARDRKIAIEADK